MPPENSERSDLFQKYSIPISIVVAGLLVAGAVYLCGAKTGTSATQKQQPQENSLSESQNIAHVLKVTGSITGIDANKVKTAVASNKDAYDKAIAADQQEGASFGIQGTPGFIVGKTLIAGAEAFSSFK